MIHCETDHRWTSWGGFDLVVIGSCNGLVREQVQMLIHFVENIFCYQAPKS